MNIYNRPFRPIQIWQFLLANAVLSLVILLIFFSRPIDSPVRLLLGFIWSFSICVTQWIGPMIIGNLLDKKFPWIEQPVARTFIEIFSLLMWSVSAFVVVQLTMLYLINGMPPADSWVHVRQSIVYTLLISLFISLVFTAVGFFKAWRVSVLREAELNAQMMAYKYESLRNQINPHFLFNSFNVLSDLVYDDQAQAVKFIRQLSDLFRYVLDSRDKELVSLGEELTFLDAYIYLLKTRFGDKLDLKISLTADAAVMVVPMTLQLLLENAVKHNELSDSYPLTVEIRRAGDYMEVENTLRPKNVGEDSKNTGLKNIMQQYSFFTDRLIEVCPNERTFLVRIPLIQTAEQ